MAKVRVGDPMDFRNFMAAVIDEASFDQTMGYIQKAIDSKDAEIIFGGHGDKTKGYFVEPTIILTTDPKFITMEEEIFSPVLTIYVYDDASQEATLKLLDSTSPYALTGAMVGHQPFGGGRMSGTNDKAGSFLNLIRCTSPRTIKECFTPHRDFSYPFMNEA